MIHLVDILYRNCYHLLRYSQNMSSKNNMQLGGKIKGDKLIEKDG